MDSPFWFSHFGFRILIVMVVSFWCPHFGVHFRSKVPKGEKVKR